MGSPVRSCLYCRKRGAKGELIKLVNTPAGVVIDYSERLPGRGAYLCFDRTCIVNGLKEGPFKRAFRGEARPPDPLAFHVELKDKALRKVRSLLGMARKSSAAAVGFDAAVDAARRSPEGLLIMAEDASEGTARRLMESVSGSVRVARFSTKEGLGGLLGTRPVGVVFIPGGGLAAALEREMGRLNTTGGG